MSASYLTVDISAKRKQMEDKRIIEAYHESDKTADEIVAFLKSGSDKEK